MLRSKYCIDTLSLQKLLEVLLQKTITDIQTVTDSYFDLLLYEITTTQNIEVLQTLLVDNPNAIVIIIGPEATTSMQEYYALQTIGYLRNTEIETDFKKLQPTLLSILKKRFQMYEIHSKRGMYKIRMDTIYYIESFRNNMTIHAKSGSYIEYKSLRKFYTDIQKDGPQFLQVHKSYIVNTEKIQEIKGNTIILENQQEIPIGRAYKVAVSSLPIIK